MLKAFSPILILVSGILVLQKSLYLGDSKKSVLQNSRGLVAGTSISSRNCSWQNGDGPAMPDAIKNCIAGNPENSSNRFFVLGDSFAGNLSGWIKKMALRSDVQVQILYVHGAMSPPFRREHRKGYDYKQVTNQFTQEKILNVALGSLNKGDTIILSNALLTKLDLGEWSASKREHRQIATKSYTEQWFIALGDLISKLKKRNLNIVIVAPLPRFDSPRNMILTNCTREWFRPLDKKCILSSNRSAIMSKSEPIIRRFQELERNHANLYLYDPMPVFCPPSNKACHNYMNAERVFIDGDHLNLIGADLLAPDLANFLAKHRLLKN
jgi:lysophospholipase L1-like esterase